MTKFTEEQALGIISLACIGLVICPPEELGLAFDSEELTDKSINQFFSGLDKVKMFVDELPGVNEPLDYVKVLKDLLDERVEKLKEGGDE